MEWMREDAVFACIPDSMPPNGAIITDSCGELDGVLGDVCVGGRGGIM